MKGKYLGILAAVLLLGGMGVFYSFFLPKAEKTGILKEAASMEPAEEAAGIKETSEIEEASSALVYVHVCGQVKEPGVYGLEPDSRVAEAVEAAGGFTKEAQESSVNLARKVQDGEQLYVLSREEGKELTAGIQGGSESRININSAKKEELMLLPGIGAAKAEAIIAYRTQYGNFEKIEDLKKIEGIKDGVLEKIKDKITI